MFDPEPYEFPPNIFGLQINQAHYHIFRFDRIYISHRCFCHVIAISSRPFHTRERAVTPWKKLDSLL